MRKDKNKEVFPVKMISRNMVMCYTNTEKECQELERHSKMETKIVRMDIGQIDKEAVISAGEVILEGGLVAFPTETVYGLGGDALNPESSCKIYAAKGRPSDNPLIVHIADMEKLDAIVEEIPESAYCLAKEFWPGPLTMILRKSKAVPLQTTGGLETVAVRMPSHPVAREFIRAAGGYVAAPSANISGKPSPTTAKYVIQDMDGRIDMIIDADGVEIGLESTIVDLTGEIPMILRPGFITLDMLSKVIGPVEMDVALLEVDGAAKPKAPGMKYRHYAPKGELVIIEGEPEEVLSYINSACKEKNREGCRTGIIGTKECIARYHADSVKCAGSREDTDAIARQLYTFLREFDDEGIEYIYSEAFDVGEKGQAIMNRLLKAAGHKIIKL